ncbi:hypothetical protein Tco_1277931 [Tanacetum coccineum]
MFAFIHHQDPTKVRVGKRELREGEVTLLYSTVGRVVEIGGANNQNIQGVNIVNIEAKVPATVTELPKKVRRKRQAADDASGYALPPKRHRDDHGLSGNASASTGGKSVAAIQRLFEENTLAVEFGVMAPIIIPLITSSMTPDSISGTGLRTKHPVESVSALVPRKGPEPIRPSIFKDSASTGKANPNTAGLSHPAGAEISSDSFFIARDMDAETLQQAYVPKWTSINDSALDDLDVCRSFVDHLAPPLLFSQLRSMDYDQLLAEFNVGIAHQTCLSFEVRLRLEHELAGRKIFKGKFEVAEAIRLRGQIANDEAAKAATVSELNSLKEKNVALEAQVTTLESATANKDAELLHTMAASLEVERDGLARQDAQVKALSDRVASLDADLMEMALHMDEEFYPRFLTTLSGRRWILSHGLKHVVMKCMHSSDYLDTLGNAIGRAIDKGMQDRLAAGIEHGKARRCLENVEAYNPSAEADYVSTIAALQGSAARILEANRLQPSLEQLMLPIYQLEDGVVIGETSLSLALDVPHSSIQRLKGEAATKHLSISDAIVPLIKPLSIRNLVGEASTSGVLVEVTTTSLSTTFAQVSSVPPIPAVDAEASERPVEDRSSKIIFKEEELETTPEHATAS